MRRGEWSAADLGLGRRIVSMVAGAVGCPACVVLGLREAPASLISLSTTPSVRVQVVMPPVS